ncbi:MAG: hypothetical protein JRH16_04385 [Deltaproteobacteria bacterium]|nr:hypothetical protein [Deltaproteobacteria bacterium]MBW2363058.1 hypothetical protein [Deltaproteobacteria bacterium]
MSARLVLLMLALVCLAPAASAQSLTSEEAQELLAQREASAHPAECSRLRRQIDQYTLMFERAGELQNQMWAERMGEQVEILRGLQAARCPNDVPIDHAAEAFAEMLKLAAKGAAAYFTFGATGF